MLGCCSIISCCMLSSIVLLSQFVPFLFCLPFANRASVPGDPYIDFNRNHLIFPAAYLVCQVDALFIIFPSEARIRFAYHLSHIMTCIASWCLCIAPWFIVVPLLVFLLWVEPGDEYVHEEPVEYAYEDPAFDNSENLAGKMIISSISLLFLLASIRSIAMLALPALFTMPTFCHVEPLTILS